MSVDTRSIVLGTRGSALARRQTELIVDLLRERLPGVETRVVAVQTEGDRVKDMPLSSFGDKGVFVEAIERALLTGEIDLAVHSLKDVPADVETPGLQLVSFSPRADPRDVLVSRHGETLAELAPGSRIGTSSLRRCAQLAAIRPDLRPVDIRGNVDTRLAKVRDGGYDAVILAAAGLERLGLQEAISEYLAIDIFTPDAGQAIMAVQARADDPAGRLAVSIDDPASHAAALAERALVRTLGAGCHSPVGAYAAVADGNLRLHGMAATEDHSQLHRVEETGPVGKPEALGVRAGKRLLRLLAS